MIIASLGLAFIVVGIYIVVNHYDVKNLIVSYQVKIAARDEQIAALTQELETLKSVVDVSEQF